MFQSRLLFVVIMIVVSLTNKFHFCYIWTSFYSFLKKISKITFQTTPTLYILQVQKNEWIKLFLIKIKHTELEIICVRSINYIISFEFFLFSHISVLTSIEIISLLYWHEAGWYLVIKYMRKFMNLFNPLLATWNIFP